MAVAEKNDADGAIIIKKYENRRLYNTATSSYVTLDNLCEMVKAGDDFVVYDAKTNEDITRSVLTQIIFEEENKGQNLLPIQFLRQLIRFYGDNLQSFVPSYLEMSMETFARNQEQMRKNLSQTFGGGPSFNMFEDQVRQNIALFDRAVKMFTQPFAGVYAPPAEEASEPGPKKDEKAELDRLKSQIEAMQKQLDTMSDKD